MRFSLLTGAALLAVGPALAQGPAPTYKPQAFFGLKAGMNNAVLSGTLNRGAEYRKGLQLGAYLHWRVAPRLALQPEVVYSQQGFHSNWPNGVLPLKSDIRLNYLNMPLLLKGYIGRVFYLQGGPQLGLLLNGHEKGQLGWRYSDAQSRMVYVEGEKDLKQDYRNDLGLVFGLGADLKNGLMLSARLNYGLRDINNSEEERQLRYMLRIDDGIYSRVVEVAVGYTFGLRNATAHTY